MSESDFPSSPRIAIVGAGAIGLYYGGRLAQHGHDVHFLLRRDFDAVRQRGITVQSWQGDFHLAPDRIHIYNDAGAMPKADLVIVTLKTTSNDELPTLIPPLLHENTAILTMQNGLGIEEDLATIFGAQRVLGAIAFICCNRVGAGAVNHIREGFIRIGELNRAPTQRTEIVSSIFNSSQIQCTVLPNLRRGRWEKLVWNIPFNGLGALRQQTTEELLKNDTETLAGLMYEVIQIAAAEGFEIPADLPERLIRMTAPMGPYRTSMQVDRASGSPLEIEAIIGRPLRVARERHVPVPRLEELYEGLTRIRLPG